MLTETDFTEQKETTEQTEQTEIGQLNDVDIDIFLLKTETKTRLRRRKVTLFYRWAKSVNETRTLENISEQELDKLLAHFVLNARKQNGNEYEPDTLTSMLRTEF